MAPIKRGKGQGVVSLYADLARENAKLSQEPPLICIKCVKCDKWRESRQYFERREVPEDWHCKMWVKEDGSRGSCNDPGSVEDTESEEDEPFPEGEVVWAILGNYPEWPGMIESHRDYMFSKREMAGGRIQYNVTVFGPNPSYQWVFMNKIRKYEVTDPCEYKGALKQAIEEGNSALVTEFTIRIRKYSLATLRGNCDIDRMLNGAENGHNDSPEDVSEVEASEGSPKNNQLSQMVSSNLDPQTSRINTNLMHGPSTSDGRNGETGQKPSTLAVVDVADEESSSDDEELDERVRAYAKRINSLGTSVEELLASVDPSRSLESSDDEEVPEEIKAYERYIDSRYERIPDIEEFCAKHSSTETHSEQ